MKAAILKRLDLLEKELPRLKQKRADDEAARLERIRSMTAPYDAVRDRLRREAEQARADAIARRTPEQAAMAAKRELAEQKAREARQRERPEREKLSRKFKKYLETILAKPRFPRKPYVRWKGMSHEELRYRRILGDLPWRELREFQKTVLYKPYRFAFEQAAREEIGLFLEQEYSDDPTLTDLRFDECRRAAIERICFEVVEARVPPSERRYFFHPHHYAVLPLVESKPTILTHLIAVNPQGELRRECVALARKLDARGDQKHRGMLFDLSTNRVYGCGETVSSGNGEQQPYSGPRSEVEWWAAVHAVGDRPISGEEPTRPYPAVTDETKRLAAKKQKDRRRKKRQ
jgi:hypothetical protein